MYCDRCGMQLPSTAGYCSRCGKAFGGVSPLPVQGRVASHLRLLAILWLVMSALRVLPGLMFTGITMGGMRFFRPEVPQFVHLILPAIGGFLILGGIAGLAVGWGLLTHQSWARVLAIVMGFLSLLHVPFGTALGIYTLWVLLPEQSEREYRSTAQTA